jgi:hypothetical protein
MVLARQWDDSLAFRKVKRKKRKEKGAAPFLLGEHDSCARESVAEDIKFG